jgi:hypothetical protein
MRLPTIYQNSDIKCRIRVANWADSPIRVFVGAGG